MSPKRDTLFPSVSIGRAGGAQLQRVASHESLNAHPLLSPNSPSSSLSNHTQQSSQDTSTNSAPRYVPYTPRHRPPTSSATTSMTAHSSMPVASHQQQQGGATSKLQLQNLKAAAQGIGLGNGTVGWAILEKLVDGETGPEWDEIWTAITTAKPTLLLPLEPFSGEIITPEFVKDHVAFCNGPASSPSPLVTLSGLRGSITNSNLILQSTLPLTSKPFLDLLKPETQSSALISLPPLPSSLTLTASTLLPSFVLPASTSLPLPPRFHLSKPPLPPRPGPSASTPPKPTSASRISNPFASLFGRPPISPTTSSMSTSPSQSSLHGEEIHSVAGVGVEVAAFSIGKKIIKKTAGKEISKAIKEEINASLAGCPTWVVDRVLDFTGPLHPLPKSAKRIEIRRAPSGARSTTRPRAPSILPPSTQPSSDPSSLAEAFQTFYASIEDELRAAPLGSPFLGRRKEEKKVASQDQDEPSVSEKDAGEDGGDKEQREIEEKNSEAKVREILEQVERVLCSVFYDRAFRPVSGDDASHDDALANRIAALNMLDLGLEHLGVEIPNEGVKVGVGEVVKACGEILQRLEDSEHRSPGEKSALIIEAHKKIVDGLSRLPQLKLKPENDFEEQDAKTPRASSFGKQAAQEAMNEASVASPSNPAPEGPVQKVESEVSASEAGLIASPDVMSAPSNPWADPSAEPKPSEDEPEPATPASDPTQEASDTSEPNPPEASVVDSATSPRRSSSPPVPPRAGSPAQHSRSSSPTPISGDLLFPLLIFSVVKANPAHLVSHLLYIQRFRSRSVGGQESYCLINLLAVAEFLEHVDMGALGLGDSERVMSTADLTPIPLTHGTIDSSTSPPSPLSSRLGKRMNQQVEELAGLAGSANKVLTGVVDSSFGVLRGFLTSNPDLSTPHGEVQDAAPWNTVRPGFGLLRRGSGFSIASVAASLPGAGRPKTPSGGVVEEGQQLIEVSSRPGSIKETDVEYDEGDTSGSSVESGEESPEGEVPDRGDARSVRSFSSMMSRDRDEGRERMSLTDRLASMSALSRLGTSPGDQHGAKASPPSSRPTSRPSSWLPSPAPAPPSDAPASSGTSSPLPSPPKIRIPPPNRRFLECAEQDIRVGEVGELLREYRRMVQALKTAGVFEDHV